MLPLALALDIESVGLILTVVFGVPGVTFAALRYRANHFLPKVEALLAESGDSLRVKIANRGSVAGSIHSLEVVDAEGRRISLPGAGDGFVKLKLEAGSAEEIDFNAPDGRDFQTHDTVVVRWGRREARLNPTPVKGSFRQPEPESRGRDRGYGL